MATVVISDKTGKNIRVELDRGRRYRLGRSRENEIIVSDSGLSRHHIEIYFYGDGWILADCGSSNGTFADGKRLTAPLKLDPRVRISLGNCHLAFENDEETAPSPEFSNTGMQSGNTIMLSVADVIGEIGRPAAPGATVAPADVAETLRRFNIVQRATLELLAHDPMEQLLPKVLDLVFEAVSPTRAVLLSRDADGELVCRAKRGNVHDATPISRTIADTVMDRQVSVLAADTQADERFAAAESIIFQGIRAVMAVPLWNDNKVIGLIYTDSIRTTGNFTDEDLKLLTMLGNIAAIQIQNAHLFEEQLEKRRFEKEAQAASEIQKRLLPATQPVIPGYRLVGYNEPCHEVGGDYYDCLDISGTRRAVILADVAGKGMGAALLMASLQATCHARAEQAPTAEDFVALLNRAIARCAPSNRYVTLFFADLDYENHRMRYVNAGHAPAPLLVKPDGQFQAMESVGPPLGLFDDATYEVRECELMPGDFVFACSDGVTDVSDPQGEMFEEDRLKSLLIGLAGQSPETVREKLDAELAAYAAGSARPDDLTVLVFQREA